MIEREPGTAREKIRHRSPRHQKNHSWRVIVITHRERIYIYRANKNKSRSSLPEKKKDDENKWEGWVEKTEGLTSDVTKPVGERPPQTL
jgi:hypothetical protein